MSFFNKLSTGTAIAIISVSCVSFSVFANPTGNQQGGLMQQMLSANNKLPVIHGDISHLNQVHIAQDGARNGGLMAQMQPSDQQLASIRSASAQQRIDVIHMEETNYQGRR
jgi:hypothetical protein